MRVTYQLNIEKLEYNYQVLKKREEENGTILGAQKRKINRLADHLNMLKIKSAKQEKIFQQENQSLTDDYKHLNEQYKELQKKFRHFQLADMKKFKEIWKMNEEEAKEIMRKVLQADRIIHEMQLGLKWENTHDELFRNVDPLYFRESNVTHLRDVKEAFETEMAEKIDPKPSNYEEQTESLALKFQEKRNNSRTMKAILELLCNEAGFLVEDRLQKLLVPLHRDEQSLMRLDSIFKALAVESIEDIERLTSYFVRDDSYSDKNLHKSKTDLIDEDIAKLIHPNEVINAIRRYNEEFKKGIDLTKVSEGGTQDGEKPEANSIGN
jgi:dynein regulatory complex protein 1